MFIHTHSSALNMFAKFGWKTRTFCHKKMEKTVAKLESDKQTITVHNCLLAIVSHSLHVGSTLLGRSVSRTCFFDVSLSVISRWSTTLK